MATICQALDIHDETQCAKDATASNGLFCHTHARIAFAMYKGYKRRNARLDRLAQNPPSYFRNKDTPIGNAKFEDIGDEETLKEIHDHLFDRHALLDRVIRARKLHHSRFFALKLDYGHQHYLDQLQSQKFVMLRALERLERRSAEVLYEKREWFKWVRGLEDEEEKARDAEKKKVKQEAALFRRHYKAVEARMRELRAREEEKRQRDFLESAWEERRLLDPEGSSDEEWDPIEDAVEDERGNYINLLRHFLWEEASAIAHSNDRAENGDSAKHPTDTVAESSQGPHGDKTADIEKTEDATKSKNAKKRAKQKAKAAEVQKDQPKPGEVHVESKEEMRQRLSQGQKHEGRSGWGFVGSVDTPYEVKDKAPPLREDEIETLLAQIPEIKRLLLCRLLLGQATLLPAALRANSVDEFLADEEVSNTDLRDLVLKMEQPGLQELRDACADLARPETEEIDEEQLTEGMSNMKVSKYERTFPRSMIRQALPRSYQTRREKSLSNRRQQTLAEPTGSTFVDFGDVDDQGQYRRKKIRVKVCGKWIYNYPSEKAMSRGGWLQFSVIAKDCTLHDAIELCRNWEEFFELNILTVYYYFPSAKWATWFDDKLRQQYLQLGLIPYFQFDQARRLSSYEQTPRGSDMRRTHQVLQARNFICACVKRNDPASRRFIQYLALQSSTLVVLVRDVKTGNLLVQPPDEELWTVRKKIGYGRASKAEWQVVEQVGPQFFERADKFRQWHFGFKEYYDVIIWDLEPGLPSPALYNTVQITFIKALRLQKGTDLFKPSEHILRTITRDSITKRARDITENDTDGVLSIWDEMMSDSMRMAFVEVSEQDKEEGRSKNTDEFSNELPKEFRYGEADRLEDEVLFSWEHKPPSNRVLGNGDDGEETEESADEDALLAYQSKGNRMNDFETNGLDLDRFVNDLDTDEELSDLEHEHDDGISGTLNLPISSNPYGDYLASIKSGTELTSSQQESPDSEDMQEQFQITIDRERARSFKDNWHKADLSPGSQRRWEEYTALISSVHPMLAWSIDAMRGSESAESTEFRDQCLEETKYEYEVLSDLGVPGNVHRRVLKDMSFATRLVAMFFGLPVYERCFHHEPGSRFKDSLLLNQAERAKEVPDIRSPEPNDVRPKEQWHEWDAIHTVSSEGIMKYDKYPDHWNLIVRPALAHLYKAGVICTAYYEQGCGRVISMEEPGRKGKPDLYFDWRHILDRFATPPNLIDPYKLEPLASQARAFELRNPGAKFSVLRIWSAAHFWPLMLGGNNREGTSFTDGIDRTWEWKFIPKDMCYSHVSMHMAAKLRLDPHKHYFGDKVVHRRDMVLVMGKDAAECRKLTTAAAWAIATRPWRLEVNPWKSWFNVDSGFLMDLHEKWWE